MNRRVFGRNIRYLAKINNISTSELSEKLGVSENDIKMVMQNRRTLPRQSIIEMASIFNVDLISLYAEELYPCGEFSNEIDEIMDIIEIYCTVIDCLNYGRGHG